MTEFSDDRLLDGQLTLRQSCSGHRAGTDAVVLASAVPAHAKGQAVDAGAASGAAGLMLAARRPDVQVDLVEIDETDCAYAAHNISVNALSERCRIIKADLLASEQAREAAGLVKGRAAIVISNPPFLDPAKARHSPDPARARAHVLAAGGLDAWCRALAWLAAPDALIVLIHRADALHTLLNACEGRFGAITIKPIMPRADQPATRVVLTARKGSRAPMAIVPSLILHSDDGRFTPEAAALHRGAW